MGEVWEETDIPSVGFFGLHEAFVVAFWAFRLDRDRFLCPFRIRQHRYCLALFDQTRA
jgi:hypothetical protein